MYNSFQLTLLLIVVSSSRLFIHRNEFERSLRSSTRTTHRVRVITRPGPLFRSDEPGLVNSEPVDSHPLTLRGSPGIDGDVLVRVRSGESRTRWRWRRRETIMVSLTYSIIIILTYHYIIAYIHFRLLLLLHLHNEST